MTADIEQLRRKAEGALWTGRWYDGGCDTLMAERDGECEEIIHPMPLGIVPYLVAVQPAAVVEMVKRIERLEKIAAAARNLVAVKGRHHSEIAYQRLVEALKNTEDA